MENYKKTVRKLNDDFRKNFTGWKIMITKGVDDLPNTLQREIMQAVQSFNNFSEGNDPYEEHDFWAIIINWEKFFWKIDYYNTKNDWWGSPNPADSELTERVLTIMKAEEY